MSDYTMSIKHLESVIQALRKAWKGEKRKKKKAQILFAAHELTALIERIHSGSLNAEQIDTEAEAIEAKFCEAWGCKREDLPRFTPFFV